MPLPYPVSTLSVATSHSSEYNVFHPSRPDSDLFHAMNSRVSLPNHLGERRVSPIYPKIGGGTCFSSYWNFSKVNSAMVRSSSSSSSSSSALKASMAELPSKKRKRTSPEQASVLWNAFRENRMPNSTVRQRLAYQLGMTPRAVQIWFQNRRQWIKSRSGSITSDTSSDMGGSGSKTPSEHSFEFSSSSSTSVRNDACEEADFPTCENSNSPLAETSENRCRDDGDDIDSGKQEEEDDDAAKENAFEVNGKNEDESNGSSSRRDSMSDESSARWRPWL